MKLVSFDVETAGVEDAYALQPFRARNDEAWLTMWACATSDTKVHGVLLDDDDPAVRRVRTVTSLGKWLRSCAERKLTICGWNVAFDMGWLIALGLRDEVYANKWLDGMMLWRHLTASPEWTRLAPPSYSLKQAVRTSLPEHAGYEEGIDFLTSTAADVLDYNKKDALFTLQLTKKFLSELTPEQRRTALIEAACLPLVAEANVEGLCADRDTAQQLADKLKEQADVAMVTLKLTTQEDIDAAVLASPTKLRKLLYEDWGLPVVKVTDKGANSTDRDALSQLAPLDPRAGLLNEFRECTNNRTKFALGTVNSLDYNGDGCVRPSAKPFGTYTGRMTYSSKVGCAKNVVPTGVALHQWKRDPAFRDIIEAPEGYTLMEFDFAGQEFRWMAVMSKDPTMLQMCEPGEDAHAYMGAKIAKWSYDDMKVAVAAGDPQAKSSRQMGKVGNLSCQYRTSARTLQRVARVMFGLDLSQQEAKAIHGTYRLSYPMVPRYWENQITLARNYGYVETVAGRRVHLGTGDRWAGLRVYEGNGDVFEEYVDNTWGSESTAINFPIQGAGADQKYLALAVLRDMLPRYGGRFYFELHDGLFVIVPDAQVERAYVAIKKALSNLPYEKAWGVTLPVAFPVDGKVGKKWGSMRDPGWC